MGGRAWTTGEVRRLNELRRLGFKVKEIAGLLNRTEAAVYSFLKYVPKMRGRGPSKQPIVKVAKPPKLEPCERLRIATLLAIAAYANANRLDIDAAARRLLYPQPFGFVLHSFSSLPSPIRRIS